VGRTVAHTYAAEAAVQNGQPDFPHTTHVVLTVVTCGLWGPIYWGNWLVSRQRRYRRARRRELRRHGIG
jgi:hypothetical protein